MRFATLSALFLATPAFAWEFEPLPVCTVTHETDDVALEMTYNHSNGQYALSLTTDAPWPDDPVFAMRFDGAFDLTIATDRQVYSSDRRTLTARDQGFSNVLNGLQFNTFATPIAGNRTIPIPLNGAAEVIKEFRDCTKPVLS